MQFRPLADANGSGTFSFCVQDDGGTAQGGVDLLDQSLTIAVTPVNDVPSFTRGDHQMINEDAGAQTVLNWAAAISRGPANESGQTLNFLVTTDNSGLFSALPAVNPTTGTLTYTPAANAYGVANVSVALHDNGGTAAGGVDTSPSQSFLIVVGAVNDAPTISSIANQTIDEDTSAGPLAFTIADLETPGDMQLSVQSSNPALVPIANIVLAGTGSARTLTVTPLANASGSTTITLNLSDGHGGTASTSFTLYVNAVADPLWITPIADATTGTGTPVIRSFAVSDGDTKSLSLTLSGASSHAALVQSFVFDTAPDGSRTVTVNPAAGQSGVTIITITAEDAQQGSAQTSFQLTVTPGGQTVGLYHSGMSIFTLKNSNTGRHDDGFQVGFGLPDDGWKPVTGDWDFDAQEIDTVGVYDPGSSSFVWMRDDNWGGLGGWGFGYGSPNSDWIPIAGDWDGIGGYDTIGLYDPTGSVFYLRNSNDTGAADITFGFGPAGGGCLPVAGDWNGDGTDTVGLYDPADMTFYLASANVLGGGSPNIFSLQGVQAGCLPLAGDWNADGTTTVGVLRPATETTCPIFYLKDANAAGTPDNTFAYGSVGVEYFPVAGHWNTPPTISAIANQTSNEDAALVLSGVTIADFQSGESQPLTVTATAADPTLFEMDAQHFTWDPATSQITLTPKLHQSGTTVVTITVDDDQQGIASTTFTWQVDSVNDEPSIGDIPERATTKNRPITVPLAITDPDTSPDLLTVEATVTSNPGLVAASTVTRIGAVHSLTITPAQDACGIATIQVSVSDGQTSKTTAFTISVGHQVSTFGLYDPAESMFSLRQSLSTGNADIDVGFGAPDGGWLPIMGDWDGDGDDTLGLFDPDQDVLFYLKKDNTAGFADFCFGYGAESWLPIAGDWDGDGIDTIGLYDPATSLFYLRNANTTGYADLTFGFGAPGAGWLPVAGDWEGDGTDTIGLYDPATSTFYLRNANTSGPAHDTFAFGVAGGRPVVGDWDGDGDDTIGLYDPASAIFLLTNTNGNLYAEHTFAYGVPGSNDIPLAGDWDGVLTSPPIDVGLSNYTIPENQSAGTIVGTLTTVDPDDSGPHVNYTYALTEDSEQLDNDWFRIEGHQLEAMAKFNYEVKSSYTIRRRSDGEGSATEKGQTFTVNFEGDWG